MYTQPLLRRADGNNIIIRRIGAPLCGCREIGRKWRKPVTCKLPVTARCTSFFFPPLSRARNFPRDGNLVDRRAVQ